MEEHRGKKGKTHVPIDSVVCKCMLIYKYKLISNVMSGYFQGSELNLVIKS